MRWFTPLYVLFAFACNSPEPAECAADSDCGDSAICEEGGTCRSVECRTTQECVFGSYCSDAYSCDPGCGSDLDCPAGEQCNSNTCEPYGCRSTQLDCQLGEYCDDGECKLDDRGHCAPCDLLDANSCGNNGVCVYYAGPSCQDAGDCEAGERCDNVDGTGKICHRDVCLVQCNANAELTCPRGLECVVALSGTNQTYCAGDCPYLIEQDAF